MKRHLILLPMILGFMIAVYANIASQTSQDSSLVPSHLRLSLYREKYPELDTLKLSGDSTSIHDLFIGGKIPSFNESVGFILLGLLKEYQVYCDTVTIGRWEYFTTQVKSDSPFGTWKMDSSLVRFPRKQYGLIPLFPKDFIYWIETIKLKEKQK